MLYHITFRIIDQDTNATYEIESHNRLVAQLNARTQAMRDFKTDMYGVRLLDVQENVVPQNGVHPVIANILKPYMGGSYHGKAV